MSALAQLNAIEKVKGSPADQQALLQSIMQTHGSATNFYRAAAKEMGTTPDHVMEKVEQMAQLPQTAGLQGANAGTSVPQTMTPPMQLNAQKVDTENRALQGQGMGTAQAVNTSAQNPQNTFAKGGEVTAPPSEPVLQAKVDTSATPSDDMMNALKDVPAFKDLKSEPSSSDRTEQMFKDYENKGHLPQPQTSGEKAHGQDATKKGVGNDYAKGGPVHDSIKNMPLKDIVKLLASHPELAGGSAGNAGSPMQGSNMKEGGAVAGQNDPDVKRNPAKLPANMKREAKSHGAGLMNMNVDVPGYNEGGEVHMDTGGGLEADSITGYGPDGTPIVQNPDGTQSYGDINSLLDRPESAPTLGTGQSPQNATTTNAANSVAQQQPTGPAQNVTNNMMAKGGEEAPPPGALKNEVADNVPAQLSEGEFVFSADATRFWGLRLLNQMMDHARSELSEMANEGAIRHPGDGKNPDEEGFKQDQQPNMNAYSGQNEEPDEDEGDQILKECMGGGNFAEGGLLGQNDADENFSKAQIPQTSMATGGGISEEHFAKGGSVSDMKTQYGRSNMVSSHPKGGTPLLDYAKGGIVSSISTSLAPKKMESMIPENKVKTGMTVKGGSVGKPPSVKTLQPKLAKGGLLSHNVNNQRNINQSESMIGA